MAAVTIWQIEGGENGKHWQILFSWTPKSLWTVTAAMKLKDACSFRKDMTNLDSILKRRDINLPTKVFLVKVMVFPGVSHIWM